MDDRARIPVTLPRDKPTQPFWQDPPDATVADLQTTPELPTPTVDVVIVGSGITGASVAWHWLQTRPTDAVVMLEARQAASGASGRNGGHTKAASYRSFLGHAAQLGTAEAVRIAQLELDGIRAVHKLAAGSGGEGSKSGEPGIDCDAFPCQTLDIIYDPAQWKRAQEAVAAMRAALPAGHPVAEYTIYSREEALADPRIPCSDDLAEGPYRAGPLCGAVRYEAGSISAYRFVVGMLKKCLARGLHLQTHTPVVKLERAKASAGGGDNGGDSDRLWLVHTPRGIVRARQVVLATNAYTAYLVPQLQGVVVPLRGHVTMHRPGQNMPGARPGGKSGPEAAGLEHTYSFIYPGGYEYMISRPPGTSFAGDIIIGGGLKFARAVDTALPPDGLGLCEYGTTDDTTINPSVSAYLHSTTGRYFGETYWGADHVDGRVRREWSGIMGYTPDGFPLVGELPDQHGGQGENGKGLLLCCAFQGHGMVYSWLCGRAVVEMAQGRDGEALRQWFPESFRVHKNRLSQEFVGRLHVTADE